MTVLILSLVANMDLSKLVQGKMAWFNMWDYRLDEDTILSLGCYDKGNIVSWDTLKEKGYTPRQYEMFPCKGKLFLDYLLCYLK